MCFRAVSAGKKSFPILSVLFLAACGGSSSETPMPLEPLPHVGPEPASAPNPVRSAEPTKSPASSPVSPAAGVQKTSSDEPDRLSEPALEPEQETESESVVEPEGEPDRASDEGGEEELNPAGALSPTWDD